MDDNECDTVVLAGCNTGWKTFLEIPAGMAPPAAPWRLQQENYDQKGEWKK